MWVVKQISESDFGCEERLFGEPLLVKVVLECDDGRICQFEASDEWLRIQDIDEGDEWPWDLDEETEDDIKALKQEAWMENYYEAVEEMEEE